MQRYIAFDAETYYDAEYDIKTLGVWAYVFHPSKFDCYLISIEGDGISFVGHPSKFDWNKLRDAILVAHNAAFDGLVLKRLVDDHVAPEFLRNVNWVCTADLSVYLSAPRSLDKTMQQLFGIKVSKVMRTEMKGKTYAMAVSAGLEEKLLTYGGDDAKYCYRIWQQYGHLWPEKERRASKLNREAGWYGVNINVDALNHALIGTGAQVFPGWVTDDKFEGLEIQQFNALRSLPWVKNGEPPLSPEAIRAEGRRVGMVDIPASLAATSQDAMDWEDRYADKFPWVAAIRTYRRTNALMKKFQSIKAGLRPDNTFSYQTRYFGAHTGRFSGGSNEKDDGLRFNIQNLPRKPMFGVDLRKVIIPRPGKRFVIIDYAQIEARMLLWRVGDKTFMDMLRKEGNLYQAYAKKRGTYSGSALKKDNFDLYQHSKVEVLGCGYACGANKYKHVAKSQYDIVYTDDEAKAAIKGYRLSFPLVPLYWAMHHGQFRSSINHGDATHEIVLASNRKLVYFNPQGKFGESEHGKRFEMMTQFVIGGPQKKVYGGLLTENEIQATSRDVMVDGWIATYDAGYAPLFSVHDELVFEVDVKDNVGVVKDLQHLMCNSSLYMSDCPLDTEAQILDYYTK